MYYWREILFFSLCPTSLSERSSDSGQSGDTSSRGNVDSGFLSEVPDDLRLLHGTSVESLASGTSEERGGSVCSPPPPLTPDPIEVGEVEEEEEEEQKSEPEIWDEARVSCSEYLCVFVLTF